MITALTQLFATTNGCPQPSFFGLHSWYYYLQQDPKDGCSVIFTLLTNPKVGAHVFTGTDIALVGLAVIDDLLIIAGLVTIGFIIYGGISYMTSQGDPQSTAKAQSTIQSALIGLVISILAIALVRFLGSKLGQVA